MAAPVYDSLQFDLPASIFRLAMFKDLRFHGADIPNDSWATPALPRERLTVGTGAGQFNTGSEVYPTAAASGVTSYDLTTLTDPLGNAINLDNVRFIFILNYNTTAAHKLLLDATATNAWTGWCNGIITAKAVIPPGWTDSGGIVHPGIFLLGSGAAAGLATSGTSKVVALDAGANTIAHALLVVGVDA